MRAKVALVGCSTMMPEFSACSKQLGLPAKLYATKPVCLFRIPRETVDQLLAGAARRHEHLVVALGECCGAVVDMAEQHEATLLRTQNCRHLYLGPHAYDWCASNHTLPLSCHCFRMTLRQAREPLRELLGEIIRTHDIRRIAAIDDGLRHPDPANMQQVAEMTGCETTVLHTGLGHLREAMRGAMAEEGVSGMQAARALIDPRGLGPGDDCLILSHNGEPCLDSAADLLANSLERGLKCVWATGRASPEALAARLERTVPDLRERLAAGALEITPAEEIIALSGAGAEPEQLVHLWKTQALEAMNGGYTGLAVIHGYGWSESAGLPVEYLLDYASRMSAACSLWPLLSATECPPERYSEAALEELARTHPLIWDLGSLATSEEYLPADEYLGAEGLLGELGTREIAFTCRQVAPLVSALLDGELSGTAAAVVAEHVSHCPACGELVVDGGDVKRMLGALRGRPVRPPGDLWDRIARRLDEGA